MAECDDHPIPLTFQEFPKMQLESGDFNNKVKLSSGKQGCVWWNLQHGGWNGATPSDTDDDDTDHFLEVLQIAPVT